MTRILISGGPRTGKTTLAREIGNGHSCGCAAFERRPGFVTVGDCDCPLAQLIHHTDDLIPLGWSEASQAAALWLEAPGPWIVEGVAASRALRKWRDQHPNQPPPVDRVIFLREPHETLSKGQAVMAKGVETVHAELADWLGKHNITTEYR
jgi:hypothetical protein